MSAKDALLFIDANKYLDLYRTDTGRKLIGPLAEQASYIFVTQQVVAEVSRNKIGAAAQFLKTKRQGVNLRGINVPDHFSGSETEKNKKLIRKMSEISKSVSAVNAEIDAYTLEILAQVAESKDEVSKELAPIFSNAVPATPDEVRRARERKEMGNPPGKRNDPLGDEITWEQILSHFKGKRQIWVISRDGDYGTAFGGSLFLNAFLRSELAQIAEGANVYLFEDLVKGLTHFVETTKVKANSRLTAEEVTEIEAEEKSLPPVDSSRNPSPWPESAWSAAGLSQAIASVQPSAEVLRAIASVQPSAEVLRAIASVQLSAEVLRAIASVQPSAEVLRAIASVQPSAEALRAIAAMRLPSQVPKDEDG